MNVVVIGTGYVGLVTGTCFAESGNHVTCVDIDANKIARLRLGYVPIYEPQLEDLVERNIANGKLFFTSTLAEVAGSADIIFLTLPTPADSDGSADLSIVLSVVDQLGPLLKNYTVIVDKSTVPVGTAEKVTKHIKAKTSALFHVVSNPAFLREGYAVADFMQPERIVIGTTSEKARNLMKRLYGPFADAAHPMFFMDQRSAEITEYAANGFLVTKVSYINEIANLCERVGADIDAVRVAMGADSRIGNQFLAAGIGYGGGSFPKDVTALQKTANDNDYDLKIIKAAMAVNTAQQHLLVDKVKEFFGDSLKGKKFALWGLSFKPNTDDIREAPSLVIIDDLLEAGAQVVAFDPEAAERIQRLYKNERNLAVATDKYQALQSADGLLIATEWQEFKAINFEEIKSRLKKPIIFDGRNMHRPEDMTLHGLRYISIGRGAGKAYTKI